MVISAHKNPKMAMTKPIDKTSTVAHTNSLTLLFDYNSVIWGNEYISYFAEHNQIHVCIGNINTNVVPEQTSALQQLKAVITTAVDVQNLSIIEKSLKMICFCELLLTFCINGSMKFTLS